MISGEWTGTRHDEGSGLEIQQIMMNWMSCWLSWMGRRGLILILGVSYVMCCLVSIVNLLFIMFILTCFTSNWIVCTTLHKINWHGIARSGSHSQRKIRFSICWWLRVLPSLLTDVQTIPSPMTNHLKDGGGNPSPLPNAVIWHIQHYWRDEMSTPKFEDTMNKAIHYYCYCVCPKILHWKKPVVGFEC
jgi:hypothetical protein